jgi:hypothetical protein
MPHVQIDGTCDIRGYWESFEPQTFRQAERIVKTHEAYRARGARGLLIECTVVEGYLRQNLLVQIVVKDGGALVKIFHVSHPEKTDGVRHCLAWIATTLIEKNPGSLWAGDNLGLDARPPRRG